MWYLIKNFFSIFKSNQYDLEYKRFEYLKYYRPEGLPPKIHHSPISTQTNPASLSFPFPAPGKPA
jgi:hypothetical protein